MAEVETLAWLLDNSIPVPFFGGRRFGVDAIIGLVPGFGDLVSAGLGLFVVWRASRMGLPRIVVARMLINSAIDLVVGVIPFAGDAFDLWFKSNTRNLDMARRWLELPDRSTRDEWLALLLIVGILVGMIAFVIWVVAAVISAFLGLFA
jgi:preprotein translocase subunit Sss1